MRPETRLYQVAKQERDRYENLVQQAKERIAKARVEYERQTEDNYGWSPTMSGRADTSDDERLVKKTEPELREWSQLVEFLATDGDVEPPARYKEFLRAIIQTKMGERRNEVLAALVDEAQARVAVEIYQKYGYSTNRAELLLTGKLAQTNKRKAELHEWDQVRHYAVKKWKLEPIPFKMLVPVDEQEGQNESETA